MTKLTISAFIFSCLISCTGQVQSENSKKNREKHAPTSQTSQQINVFNATTVNAIDQNIRSIFQDKSGTYWFGTNGAGVYRYDKKSLTQFTVKDGLGDNQVLSIQEDDLGNIWFGTGVFGVSKFDGKTYTNFTKDGIIEGIETYNFCEDRQGNIWFSAEGYGLYRYDGANFTQFTTEDGLTTNVVQSIYEDNKGQLWFGTWQGISIYDGKRQRTLDEVKITVAIRTDDPTNRSGNCEIAKLRICGVVGPARLLRSGQAGLIFYPVEL